MKANTQLYRVKFEVLMKLQKNHTPQANKQMNGVRAKFKQDHKELPHYLK